MRERTDLRRVDRSPKITRALSSCRSESGSTVGRFDDAGDRSRDLSANSGSAYCSGRSWTDATPSSESEQGEIGPAEDPRVKAASVVRRVLMLNAWRRRRAEIAQLEQQVEHLHLQIEFLRRLLVAENDRVGRLNGELQREKSQSEEAARERDAAKSVRLRSVVRDCRRELVRFDRARFRYRRPPSRSRDTGNRRAAFTAQFQLRTFFFWLIFAGSKSKVKIETVVFFFTLRKSILNFGKCWSKYDREHVCSN